MLRKKLSLLPNKPGCYLMKNKDNIVIYIGKAKNLKNRVNSYFRGKHYGKTAKLVSEIKDFEYIVVNSEIESLILENNLIKKYDPKYNILLRDDKSYPYIELTEDEIPKLSIVRNLNRKKNQKHLYGPYPNVAAARETVNLLNRIYPLRKCKNFNKKTCLYYHIGECLGYCENKVDSSIINQMREEIIKFLKGDCSIVKKKIEEKINKYSEKLEYEHALEYKKMLDSINIVLNKQTVELSDTINRDVFGYYVSNEYLSVQVFFIRGAKIVGRHSKIFPLIEQKEEQLTKYISSFYDKDIIKPREILVPNIVNAKLLTEFLGIKVIIPIKGEKKKLVQNACNNSKILLNEKIQLIQKDENRTTKANEDLKKLLNLSKLDKIEIFDNAHLFGNYNVSGMVVFQDGKPYKNGYRKFKISIDTNDDYQTMKEAIYRRYFRVLKDGLEKPDLIIVDGGVGQVNAARQVINSLNMQIPVVGLKKDDKHSTSTLLAFDQLQEINIDKHSDLFHLLTRMQDEVHEFTINYHKALRSKGSLSSILDNVEGIGIKRRNELLKKYKTINKIKNANICELEKIIPKNVALNLLEFLKEYK